MYLKKKQKIFYKIPGERVQMGIIGALFLLAGLVAFIHQLSKIYG